MDIKIASQEKLTFLKKIEEIFLDKVIEKDAIITDESTLSDFICIFDVSNSIKELDNGKHLFKFKVCKKLFSNEFEEKIVEEFATNEKQEYINKAKLIFGVDISDKTNLYLPELFHYIIVSMPEINKKRLNLI